MKFRYEEPSLARKQDAIDFINEFIEYNSRINGCGRLQDYIDNYEGWLEKLEKEKTAEVTDEEVPKRTFFFVRIEDNKIIGMVNIRLKLNKKYYNFGGNIGYGIRPTERGNGYNKINLYLALKVCKEYGVKEAMLDVDSNNPASWRTMEALGAHLEKELKSELEGHDMFRIYTIDVDKSVEKYKDVYEEFIEN